MRYAEIKARKIFLHAEIVASNGEVKKLNLKCWCKSKLCCGAPLIVVALCILIGQSPARAASGAYYYGEVIYERGCPDIFGVSQGVGFSIVEVTGGPQINAQDVLEGDLNRIGRTTALDVTRNNQQIDLIVLDSLLSRTQYESHLIRYCRG